MDLKDKEYLIRVTEYDGLDYDSIVFTQNDTNNCRLNVEMFEPVDQLVIIIDKNDKTQVVDTLTYVEGNKYTYDMPISTINVTGNHRGYLVAYGHEDDRRTLGGFKYKVNAEPNVENIATDTEYPILTQLISDTSTLNNTIAEKEIIRDDYYLETIERENARNDSEIKRVTSENNRVAEFNGIKNEFEDLKKVTIGENVAVNLQNQVNLVNTQLETKATYFETINDMKLSNKIKINTICKTLGYYSLNDGGGALYRITNNTPLGNGFSFALDNGLTAELLYTDEISIKQLGARDYDEVGNKIDIKPYIELYFTKANMHVNASLNTKLIKLFIPSGRWFTSPLNMKASSIYIYGCNTYSYPYATGTIIHPITDNQEYMWCVGDNTTDTLGREYGNITLKNIMFTTRNALVSDGVFAQALTSDKCFRCNDLFIVSRVYGGIFENIHFTNYIGTAFKMMSSNESIFTDFSFRNGDAFENGNVVFDADVSGNKNISACFFDKFSFEGVKGDLFNFKKDSKYINNQIGTVLFEDRNVTISKDGVMRNYVVATDGPLTFESKSVFNIEEQEYCELIVDNVLLNNFGRCVFTLNSKDYLFDTIVKENGKVSKGQANIKTISHTGARRDTMIYNKAFYEGLGSFNFNVTCESASHIDSDLYSFIVKTTGSVKPFIRYKNTMYERCIDYVLNTNVLFNKNGKYGYYMPVVSDNESVTNEKLVVNNLHYKRYVPSFSSEHSSFIIPCIGNKISIRVKTKVGFQAQAFLTATPSTYQNYTNNSKGETYQWYTIDVSAFRTANVGQDISFAIRTLTADETNYVKLDVFYWE